MQLIRIFIVLILLIASFVGGIYYERLDRNQVGELNRKIREVQGQVDSVSQRNLELKETLKLVKRQIQTDRIAYQSLQEIVENSEHQQSELKNQLEKQRKLLKSLQGG